MRQDISPSKANPEYIFDARNIRLTARGNDTLLSISNELGNTKLLSVNGTVKGYCVLNNYLIVFTKGSYIEHNANVDTIYRIYKNNDDTWNTDILYCSHDITYDGEGILLSISISSGNLNFGDTILTLGIYENENVQKVYWVDGVNLPRVINIVKDWLENKSVEEIAQTYTNTSFDFIPTLELNESVNVKTLLESNGKFSAGTVQYAFTYYNKYGLESNIFYTTDLYYITYNDRGCSPDDTANVSFKITLNNLDYKHFNYVRIYSIHRTSVDSTPEVKRVIDLPTYSLETSLDYKDVHYIKVNKNSNIEVNGKPLSEYSLYIEYIEWDRTGYDKGNYYKFTKQEFADINITVDDITVTHSTNSAILISEESVDYPKPEGILITAEEEEGARIRVYQKAKIENKIIFIDNNTTGESLDPTFLLYVGGEEIIANTLNLKDNTLFLGNIELKKLSIASSIKNLLKPTFDKDKNKWITKINIHQDIRNINTIGSCGSYYIYSNLLTEGNPTTFKIGEHYRLGLQFLYSSGKWSEPLLINYDYTVTPKYKDIDCRPKVATSDNITYSLPYLYITLTTEILEKLIDNGYKKVRAVIVNPSILDRLVILLGIVNPTVWTPYNRGTYKDGSKVPNALGDIYAQSSWFFRPFHSGTNDIDEYKNSNAGGYLLYKNVTPINYVTLSLGKIKDATNICGAEIEYTSDADAEKLFYVDLLFLNIYSPDIEFDSSILQLSSLKFTFKKVGLVQFDASVGDINILTSSPTIGSKATGFIHKTTNFLWSDTYLNSSAKGLVSNLFYADYVVDEIKGENRFLPLTDLGSAVFLVCPWQSSGSLNNDINRPANSGTRSAVLKRKIISNLKVSFNNKWLDSLNSPKDVLIEVFNSDLVSLLKYNQNNYLGNVDTLLTYDGEYSKVAKLLKDGSYKISTVNEVFTLVGDQYKELGKYNPTIRMKYKTAPHIVFKLGTALTKENSNKPHLYLMDICRDTVDNAFGGTSDAALKANQWIPSGPPVKLDSSKIITVDFLHGDCYYQRYDCLKTYPFTQEDENSIVEIGSFMVETRVNIDGRYDRNRGQNSNLNMTPQNFNLLNTVYSQKDNFFNYRVLDNDFYKLSSFPNTITWSKEKFTSEEIDTWTNITMTNTFDVDGNLGKILSIENYNNELYCFLDKGISKILFNNRVLINPSDNIPIEISNGYKVLGKVYISNTVGCQNQRAIKVTPNGIYFSDLYNSGIYLLNQLGMLDISTPRGFTNWVKEYLPNRIYYDTNNGDLYFLGDKWIRYSGPTESTNDKYQNCLCFSEKFNEFTSFMDYSDTLGMFNIEDNFYAFGNYKQRNNSSTLYKLFEGSYNNIFGYIFPYHITYISNQNPTNDKIFNTLEFRADTLLLEDKLLLGSDTLSPNICPFNRVIVWNEYQEGEATLSKVWGKPSNLKEKFRTWRVNIPRDKSNNRDRIRNPWIYLKLLNVIFEGDSIHRMLLHDLQVYYYDNSIYGYGNLRQK